MTTANVRRTTLAPVANGECALLVDGQEVIARGKVPAQGWAIEKVANRWRTQLPDEPMPRQNPPRKEAFLQGPIDDAYLGPFTVVAPTNKGGHDATGRFAKAELTRFEAEWDRYFRGALPRRKPGDASPPNESLVLLGDPARNPLLARVLPGLPIAWTKDALAVNGVVYDAKTHVPILIYPLSGHYVVINSGHTFREADLKGTNALFYPRLGDWAVVKPTPTERDPAAYEVVAAGLFDENWQFPKK